MTNYEEDSPVREYSEHNNESDLNTGNSVSKRKINTECGHTVKQASQRYSCMSILAEIQNPAGHSLEQSITPRYALSEALDQKLPEILKKFHKLCDFKIFFFLLNLKI